ncbi:MAG: hypothetical protein QOK28_771 [Actinomycetota bacterium]|jgi:hypothetical protein
MRYSNRRAGFGVAAAAVAALLSVVPFGGRALAATPAASAFGATIQAGGQDVVPPTPTATVAAPAGDDTHTLVDIPAQPVAVNGTLTATANVHRAADIPSGLTVVPQAVAGPYNGRSLAQIEGAGVLFDVVGQGVPILSAAAIRSEAAVVCGASPRYTANSEIIDLNVAGSPVPLNAPAQQLIDAISGALSDSGLNAVVDVQRNVVTQIPGGGIGVDALVVTILAAAGDTPLAKVRLAHAEVTASACAAAPQCSDGVDNDGDAKIDTADPGCHSDGDATHANTYVASDDDESNEAARAGAAVLPRTGGEAGFGLEAAALATLAALGLRLRRRTAV